jgi:hypothetical protein
MCTGISGTRKNYPSLVKILNKGGFMSLGIRILFFGLTGVIAGVLSWPFAEGIIFIQTIFPSLLIFTIVTGIVIGLAMGGTFGTSEGILSMSGPKIGSGALWGISIGACGGALGFIAGQAALLYIGTLFYNSSVSFKYVGLPVSKAIGWAIFGAFLGVSEGIRSKSINKVRNGIIGGFLGGLLGGFAFEYLRVFWPGNMYARLTGLVVLGLLIGVFYGLIEINLSKASLILLNGKYSGREYPLTQGFTTVGSSPLTVVGVPGYTNVDEVHAEIKKKKKDFVVNDSGTKSGTFVNDDKIKEKKLEDGDVIRVGEAQFLFKKKK